MNIQTGDFVLTTSGCAARVERVNVINGQSFYLGALVHFAAWGPVVGSQTELFAASEIVAVKQKAAATAEAVTAA